MRPINIDALRKATRAMRETPDTPSDIHRGLVEAGVDPHKWFETERISSEIESPSVEMLAQFAEALNFTDDIETLRENFGDVIDYIDAVRSR